MKTCFKCRQIKPLSEFYTHPAMKDGHLNKCKSCTQIDSSRRIAEKRLDLQWVLKERERGRRKQKEATLAGRARRYPEVQKAWRIRNRHKSRAHSAAQTSHPRPTDQRCQNCGALPVIIHRHHPDYSKPTDIVWLCPACHGAVHRKGVAA